MKGAILLLIGGLAAALAIPVLVQVVLGVIEGLLFVALRLILAGAIAVGIVGIGFYALDTATKGLFWLLLLPGAALGFWIAFSLIDGDGEGPSNH